MIDLQSGSVGWAFGYFRKELLTGLISDLNNFSKAEMPDDYCLKIQDTLKEFSEQFDLRQRPGWIGNPLPALLDDFRFTYKNWNSVKGESFEVQKERSSWLSELKKNRRKITRRLRKTQNLLKLETKEDGQYVIQVIDSFKQLSQDDPVTFKWVKRSVKRFEKRMSNPKSKSPIKSN